MKILYVTTVSNTVNAFLIPHIKMLVDEGHQVDVAFNIVHEVSAEIISLGCKVHELEFERSPFKRGNYLAFKKLKKIIKKEKYDIIHTHTPIASVFARLACKSIENIKVVYTAHGFHFFKGAPLKNWLVYYPIEYWLSKYTDVLITINNEDYSRAKKSFKSNKVIYIPGVGINNKASNSYSLNTKEERKILGLTESDFVLLSVGELNKNKNHETIIKAIANLNDSKFHYIICGEGYLRAHLEKLISTYELTNNIHLLGFRTDIENMYKIADLFVFPSFREGLSVSVMEAMLNRIPIISSKIRGNVDLIEDEVSGYLIDAKDVKGFQEKIIKIAKNSDVKNNFINRSYERANVYGIENVLICLKDVYSKLYK